MGGGVIDDRRLGSESGRAEVAEVEGAGGIVDRVGARRFDRDRSRLGKSDVRRPALRTEAQQKCSDPSKLKRRPDEPSAPKCRSYDSSRFIAVPVIGILAYVSQEGQADNKSDGVLTHRPCGHPGAVRALYFGLSW